jgi:predicted RNA-binding protein YlxR (DUF448 family)
VKGESLRSGGGGGFTASGGVACGSGGKKHDEGSFRAPRPPAPPESAHLQRTAPPAGAQRPTPPEPKATSPRRKGLRPKHVPQRMCIACRGHDAKRGLYRIVRSPEGEVEPDPTGRRNGRGAYLCGQAACWEKALASGLLARALNVEIDTETLDRLRRYAATLPLEASTAAGTAPILARTEGELR